MNTTIDIILIIYLVMTMVSLIFYVPRMLYWFEPLKAHKKILSSENKKIAIVVPAKNESKCIGRLLDSIANQTYEKENFDVFVIVDREDDPTIDIVNKTLTNAKVTIVKGQKCKGDALDGCFKEMFEAGYKCDYVSIVDADNVLDKNYLEELNNAIASGRDVIVSNRRNLNLEYGNKKGLNNWVSNCSGLTHAFQNELGNYFRSEHNMPLTFTGSGLSIRYSILESRGGWEFKTVAEDAEFSLFCTANGYTSYYANDAITYLEEGTSIGGDIKRRVRWVNGFSISQKKYLRTIKQKSKESGKFDRKYADTLYSLLPIVSLVITSLISSIAMFVTFIVSICVGSVCFRALIWSIALVLILYAFMVIYTSIGLVACKKYNKMTGFQKFIVLISNPIYCGLYVIVYFKSAFRTKNEWIPTQRLDF